MVLLLLQRYAYLLLSTLFLLCGGLLLFVSTRIIGPYDGWVVNLATEFLGGVILLVAFAAVQARVSVRRGINYDDFLRRLKGVRGVFRVSTTFLYLFVDDLNEVPARLPKRKLANIRDALIAKAARDSSMKIEILVLHPESHGAHQRGRDRPGENIQKCIESNLRFLHQLRTVHGLSNVDVRVFSALPRLSLIQWDDDLSVSFFERDRAISDSTRFLVNASQPFGEFVVHAFDQLWNDHATCTLDEFLESRRAPKLAPAVTGTDG